LSKLVRRFKAGVIELTKSMALELAPKIRVKAIAAGYALTPMQRAESIGIPANVAAPWKRCWLGSADSIFYSTFYSTMRVASCTHTPPWIARRRNEIFRLTSI
jgi:NAD(P)-dependent dehydrogenase (short-subunit alcohol dehydrogenase family)